MTDTRNLAERLAAARAELAAKTAAAARARTPVPGVGLAGVASAVGAATNAARAVAGADVGAGAPFSVRARTLNQTSVPAGTAQTFPERLQAAEAEYRRKIAADTISGLDARVLVQQIVDESFAGQSTANTLKSEIFPQIDVMKSYSRSGVEQFAREAVTRATPLPGTVAALGGIVTGLYGAQEKKNAAEASKRAAAGMQARETNPVGYAQYLQANRLTERAAAVNAGAGQPVGADGNPPVTSGIAGGSPSAPTSAATMDRLVSEWEAAESHVRSLEQSAPASVPQQYRKLMGAAGTAEVSAARAEAEARHKELVDYAREHGFYDGTSFGEGVKYLAAKTYNGLKNALGGIGAFAWETSNDAQISTLARESAANPFSQTNAQILPDALARIDRQGEALDKQAARVEQRAQTIADKYDEQYMPGALRFAGSAAESVGGMAPTIALNLALPGAGGVPGLAAMGLSAAGNSAAQAYGEGASHNQAMVYGALSGLTEIGTELLGGAILKGAGALATRIGNAAPKTAAAMARFANYLDNGIGSVFPTGVRNLGGVVSEGLEEAVSAIADPFLRRITYDPNARVNWTDVGTDAALGAVVGAFLGGASKVKNNLITIVEQNYMTTKIMQKMNATEPTIPNYAAYAGLVDELTEQGLSKTNQVRLNNTLNKLTRRVEATFENGAELRPGAEGTAQGAAQGSTMYSAMYRNPAASVEAFYDFAISNRENPNELNKSFYTYETPEGSTVDLPFDAALHLKDSHNLTGAQVASLLGSVDDIRAWAKASDVNSNYDGTPLKIITEANGKHAGILLEALPNGRVFVRTAFFGTDNGLADWIRKSDPRALTSDSNVGEYFAGNRLSLGDMLSQFRSDVNTQNTENLQAQRGNISQTLDRLAAASGVKFNIVDNLQAPEGASESVRGSVINGYYDPVTREIYLNRGLDRTGRGVPRPYGDVDSAILTTAIHEITHDIQQKDAAFHAELADAVRGLMGAEAFDAALNALPSAYRTMNAETREAEVVANFLQETLGNEDAVNRMLAEQPGALRRVLNAIREWIANVISRLTQSAGDRDVAMRLRVLEVRFAEMMKGATTSGGSAATSFTEGGVDGGLTVGGGVMYSLSDADATENKRTVAAMEPVAALTGDEFRDEKGTLLEKVQSFFRRTGNIENPDIGTIEVSRNNIRDSLSHGYGSDKIAAFAAVPEVLRQGKIIGGEDNRGNSGFDSFIVAAPVTIKNTPFFEGVIVRRNIENGVQRYYVHEVWAENSEADARSQTLSTANDGNRRGASAPTLNSVLRELWNVKRENSGGGDVMYSAADSRYTQLYDSYPKERAEALSDSARGLFDDAWAGIANNEELTLDESRRLVDYALEQAEAFGRAMSEDIESTGTSGDAALSASDRLVSFYDGSNEDYGDKKAEAALRKAAVAHQAALSGLDAGEANADVEAGETTGAPAVAQARAEASPAPTDGGIMSDADMSARARRVLDMEPRKVKPRGAISENAAEELARSFGAMENEDDGRTALLPVKSVGKILRNRGFDISTIFRDIPELYETALPAWSEPETRREGHKEHSNIKAYHNYVNVFTDGGGEYYIRFTITEMNAKPHQTGENFIHGTAISDVGIYKKSNSLGESGVHLPGTSGEPLFTDTRLQQFFDSVNTQNEEISETADTTTPTETRAPNPRRGAPPPSEKGAEPVKKRTTPTERTARRKVKAKPKTETAKAPTAAQKAAARDKAVKRLEKENDRVAAENRRLRDTYSKAKGTDLKQETVQFTADRVLAEFGIKPGKSKTEVRRMFEDMRLYLRTHAKPSFEHFESMAYETAQYIVKRVSPMPNMRTATDVEIAEANAAMEMAYRELANDILGMFDAMTNGKLAKVTRAAENIDEATRRYNELVDTYGAYEPGETPARDVKVPKNTGHLGDDAFVRRGARNAAEAAVTADETVKLIEEEIVNGVFTDTSEAQKPLMEDARTRVTTDTLDAQIGRLDAIFDERSEKQKPLSSQELADFFELYKQLNTAGRHKDAVDVMAKLAMFGTWAGRSVSAWRILKALGPGGELSKLDSVLKRFNKFDGGDYELPDFIRDKILGNEEQGIPPLDMEDDDAVAAIEAEFIDWLAARKPATRREKFRKWRYVAMLTNPVTWTRNFTGNALMAALNGASKPLERAMQRVLLPKGERTATTQRATKETRAYAEKSYAEIADILRGDDPADISARVRAKRMQFKNGIARAMDELTDAAMNGVPQSEKSAIKKVLSLLSDSKFLKMYYTNALSNYITARGIDISDGSAKNTASLDAARQYAIDEALRLTYRQDNKFSKLYNKLTSAFLTGAGESGFSDELRMILLGGALPYAKVPSNILTTALNITPAGLIYDIGRIAHQSWDVRHGKSLPPNARALAISRLAQSVAGNTLLTALGIFGSLMGVIRIKLPDDDKGDSDYQSWRRGYSLEIFGMSIPLGWAAPLSVPLFVGAAATEAVQGKLSKLGGDDSLFGVVGTIAAGMADPLFEMSMVKGVNDLLRGIRYSENGGTLLLGLAASMAEAYYEQAWPSLGGRLASIFDAAQRRTTANPENEIPDGLERALLSMAYRIPGVRNMVLEPKVDVWGREIRSEDTALRILNNLLLPASISRIEEPAFDEELGRLYETFSYVERGSAALTDNIRAALARGNERLPKGVDAEQAAQLRNMVYPSAAPQTFTFEGESGHRLDDKDYTKLARATGKLKYELTNEFINSDVYEQLSDVERAEGLDKIYRYANSISRYEMFGDRVSTTKSDISAQVYAKISGLSVGEWVSVRSRLSADAPAGSTDEQKRAFKADKAEFLIGLGLNDEQTYFTAENISGFGVTTENLDMLIDNKVPPAEYFEMYAKYGNNYKPAADPELIRSELRLNGATAREYWNRAAISDLNLASRVTGKLNAIQEISGLALGDDKKIALASALGIGVNANDIQEALDVGISADDALRYAVMQDAYASISKALSPASPGSRITSVPRESAAKGNSSSLTAMMFAIDGLDDPKYTAEQKAALYNVFPMYQIIPVNADVEDIEGLKKAGVRDWLPLRAKWVELGENGDEDSAKNYKYALWLYRESGYKVATQEAIGKAVNSSAYQSSDAYAKAVYKGAVLESYGLWSLWNEWTDYKRGLAKANGKTSISSVADINTALGYFERKRGKLTDTEKRVLFAFSTGTKASTASVVSWGKEALGRLRVA
ncbi:MAG: hypothetical protein LBK23_10505 [Oscillospiraceae bacterium]|jgi:hypothetical protein|nr:hypothetical protein [Oscillospiraceae bacterium]